MSKDKMIPTAVPEVKDPVLSLRLLGFDPSLEQWVVVAGEASLCF